MHGSATHRQCALGQVTQPLWASASSRVRWHNDGIYFLGVVVRITQVNQVLTTVPGAWRVFTEC